MRVAITGLGKAGKTTLFEALTGGKSHVVQEGKGKGVTHLGTIKVSDERVEKVGDALKAKKVVHADINFVDIPGAQVKGQAAAFDTETIVHLRNSEALAVVVRAFRDPQVDHPKGSVDPQRDAREVMSEFAFADLVVVEKRLERLHKEGAKGREVELLTRCKQALDEGKPLRTLSLSTDDQKALVGYQLLTLMPVIFVANRDEATSYPKRDELMAYCSEMGVERLELCAKLERELVELPDNEQKEFLKELGMEALARERFIKEVYRYMDLISFITVVHDEVRAWPILRGTDALRAAGKIHSDMEKGFIRAEVVKFADFNELGSMHKCKEIGRFRLEGKEYQIQDGDIITFRFHV